MGKKSIILIPCIMVLAGVNSWAQCAMCKAAVENNIGEGSAGLATGLNTGILFLFVTPYLLVTLVGLLWYWKSKPQNAPTVQLESYSGG